jgi:hypothetical protein
METNPMFRFTLAALFLFVLLTAFGCAALVHANDVWRQTAITLAVAVLLAAALAAIVWEGEKKLSALGFAVFGWGYLILAFVSALGLRDDLLTDRAVASLYRAAYPAEAQHHDAIWAEVSLTNDRTVSQGSTLIQLFDATTGQVVPAFTPVRYEDFSDIGHALWALLLACVGAMLARGLAAAPPRRREA